MLGEDIMMDQVVGMTNKTLTRSFYGRYLSKKNLSLYIESIWNPLLGYSLGFHTLVKDWLAFHFKSEENVVNIVQEKCFLDSLSLSLKKWSLSFDPRAERITKNPMWVKITGLVLEL
jgi:hypothetical protein